MLQAEHREDAGNVVDKVAAESYFNYQKDKNLRKIQRIQDA
jgi:hypothetical protein